MNKWINFAKWNREYCVDVDNPKGKAFHDSFYDPDNIDHVNCESWKELLNHKPIEGTQMLIDRVINKHNMKRWHLTIINKGPTLADS